MVAGFFIIYLFLRCLDVVGSVDLIELTVDIFVKNKKISSYLNNE